MASLGRAIRPQDELERLEIGLAGVDGRLDHRAALRVARSRPAGEAQGVAKHHDILLAPQVEMAKPQLFVDELHKLADRRAFVRRRFEIERTADMQRFDFRQPGEGDVIIGEVARDQDGNLVDLGPIEGPLVDGGQTFNDVDGMLGTIVGDGFD